MKVILVLIVMLIMVGCGTMNTGTVATPELNPAQIVHVPPTDPWGTIPNLTPVATVEPIPDGALPTWPEAQ